MVINKSFEIDATASSVLTRYQIENLLTLAQYLFNLPTEYSNFNMRNYVVVENTENTWLYGSAVIIDPLEYDRFLTAVNNKTAGCGTVACAIGHGPAAGISINSDDSDWYEYSHRFINNDISDIANVMWDWCFSSNWENYDNTAHGAAKRILYLLKHGLPSEWCNPDEYYEDFFSETWCNANEVIELYNRAIGNEISN